jgi:anionic cell wall polymer biosynthesis LytR-Cps2A-Psr (LCP) family protein
LPAFAYGDGKKTSCENVVKSVSRLFYGLPINNFAAMNLEPVGILNDAVGGVTVTAPDDVFLPGRTIKKNETVTLRGEEQALCSISRQSLLDSNAMRNVRQRQYVEGFAKSALRMTKDDITIPLNCFNKVSKYVVTNFDASKITYLSTSLLVTTKRRIDFRMVEGRVVQGENMLILSQTIRIVELILDVFYNKTISNTVLGIDAARLCFCFLATNNEVRNNCKKCLQV